MPQRVLSNHELARMVDTDDEWIVARTGITQRFIANGHETTATLAAGAAREALDIADEGAVLLLIQVRPRIIKLA